MEDHPSEDGPVDFSNVVMPDLPSAEDHLFTDAHTDWWNNACLVHGWGDGWSTYALGYRKAADIVVSRVDETAIDQDILLYPVLFLYRQYLELAIKGIIRNAQRFLGENPIVPSGHDIRHWWRIGRGLLEQIHPDDSSQELDQVGRLIEEFCVHDPASFAFRYPVTKDGTPTLHGLPDRINLRNVRDVMAKVGCLLEGIDVGINVYLERKSEAMAETREQYRDALDDCRDASY